MKKATDPRHLRRKEAIKALFGWSFKEQEIDNQLAKEVIKRVEKIDKIIKEKAPLWPIEQINRLDLAILRLAVFELEFEKKEPVKVIIDEAVELAKEFGSESSPAFVNGVLGATLKNQSTMEVKIEKIKSIIADKLGVPVEEIKPESELVKDLNAEFIEIADIVMKLKKEFQIEVPDEDIKKLDKVNDLINLVIDSE